MSVQVEKRRGQSPRLRLGLPKFSKLGKEDPAKEPETKLQPLTRGERSRVSAVWVLPTQARDCKEILEGTVGEHGADQHPSPSPVSRV